MYNVSLHYVDTTASRRVSSAYFSFLFLHLSSNKLFNSRLSCRAVDVSYVLLVFMYVTYSIKK